jgi:predicted Zn-dependent protease
MSGSRSRRSGIWSRVKRWWRRRQGHKESLRAKKKPIWSGWTKWQRSLRKQFRFATQSFFRFNAQKPSSFPGGPARNDSKRLKWTHLLNPLHWLTWPLGFLASFFLSRPYLSLGPALLAVGVIVGLIGLYAQQRYQGGRASRVQLYQRMLSTSLQNKDYERALICCKTLIDLQPNDLRFQFERAKIEKDLDRKQLANDLMFRLATQRKYGLAALWLADEQFDIKKLNDWKPEEHQLFRALLTSAIDSSDSASQSNAKLKLSSYLSSIGANTEALRYLSDLVPENPQLALTAAELARLANDPIKLQTMLPIARSYHETELSRTPEAMEHRLRLARAMIIDGDIDDACQLLEDGYKIKADPLLQNAIGEALVLKGDQLARRKQTPDLIVQRMQTIHRAVTIAPNNPLVIEALIDVTLQFRNNQNREAEVLREAAFQGLDPESVHFIRGTMALMDNNMAEAKTHLQLAAQSGIQLPGVLNNLAVAIAGDKDGDLQQALSLSNAALEQLQHPYLFETRGQILCKLERYQECILDLEKGLQSPELASAIYPSLITAYRKLGNDSLAEEYAKRLQEVQKNTPSTSSDAESTDITPTDAATSPSAPQNR